MTPTREPLSLAYKLKWWIFYHTKSLKGRYELYHFLEWLLAMGLAIAVLEGVLTWWQNA